MHLSALQYFVNIRIGHHTAWEGVSGIMGFEDRLIEQVRNFPFLYKNVERSSKTTLARENAWIEIGANLDRTPQECKTKWKHIRDSYRKNKMKIRAGLPVPKSKFTEERLSFIDESQEEATIPEYLTTECTSRIKSESEDSEMYPKRRRSKFEDELTSTHSFFRSMADVVCTFPPQRIAELRVKICNLVSEVELATIAERGRHQNVCYM